MPGLIFAKDEIEPHEKNAIRFFDDYTKKIEINFSNDKQYRVFFKVDPYYKYLTNNSKFILQAQDNFAEQSDKIDVNKFSFSTSPFDSSLY